MTSLETVNEQLSALRIRLGELLDTKARLLHATPDEVQGAVDEVIGQYNDFRADEFVGDVEWRSMVLDQIECAREDEAEEALRLFDVPDHDGHEGAFDRDE